MSQPETIGELIARKRAAGYDPEFEALLATPWICPHCQRRATILEVVIPLGTSRGPLCPRCMCEGIAPVEAGSPPQLQLVLGGRV